MTNGVSGPSGSDPSHSANELPQLQTGMGKMYNSKSAPAFKKWLEKWYPGQVTDQMVSGFERNVMQMIQSSMKESEAQHKKVQEKVKERIKEE